MQLSGMKGNEEREAMGGGGGGWGRGVTGEGMGEEGAFRCFEDEHILWFVIVVSHIAMG